MIWLILFAVALLAVAIWMIKWRRKVPNPVPIEPVPITEPDQVPDVIPDEPNPEPEPGPIIIPDPIEKPEPELEPIIKITSDNTKIKTDNTNLKS